MPVISSLNSNQDSQLVTVSGMEASVGYVHNYFLKKRTTPTERGNMIAEWIFHDGNLVDTVNNIQITLKGAPVYKRDAVVLNGTNQYIHLEQGLSSYGDCTIIVWFTVFDRTQSQCVFSFGYGDSETQSFVYIVPNPNPDLVTTTPKLSINNGTWLQLDDVPNNVLIKACISISGLTMNVKTYFNNTEQSKLFTLTSKPEINIKNRAFDLGGSSIQNNEYLNGSISYFAMWDKALSDAQIKYMVGYSPVSKDVVQSTDVVLFSDSHVTRTFPENSSAQVLFETFGGSHVDEKWTSITTGRYGTGSHHWGQNDKTLQEVVDSGANYFGFVGLTKSEIDVSRGVTYYINTYDRYRDSWDGTKYTLKYENVTIANNNGISPNSGLLVGDIGNVSNSFQASYDLDTSSPQLQDLQSTEAFHILGDKIGTKTTHPNLTLWEEQNAVSTTGEAVTEMAVNSGGTVLGFISSDKVDIYRWDGTVNQWDNMETIDYTDCETIAMDSTGNKILVGKPTGAGEVRVYEYESSSWTNTKTVVGFTNTTALGNKIELSGDGVMFAFGCSNKNICYVGKVADLTSNIDNSDSKNTTLNGHVLSAFGSSIALSNKRTNEPYKGMYVLVVGAPNEGTHGGIYVYAIDNASLTEKKVYTVSSHGNSMPQIYYQRGHMSLNKLGTQVCMNKDGAIIGASTEPDSDHVPMVYLWGLGNPTYYSLDGTEITQRGGSDDNIYSLSMSDTGHVIVVGSENKTYGYNGSTHVKKENGSVTIYRYDPGTKKWKSDGTISGSDEKKLGSKTQISSAGTRVVMIDTESIRTLTYSAIENKSTNGRLLYTEEAYETNRVQKFNMLGGTGAIVAAIDQPSNYWVFDDIRSPAWSSDGSVPIIINNVDNIITQSRTKISIEKNSGTASNVIFPVLQNISENFVAEIKVNESNATSEQIFFLYSGDSNTINIGTGGYVAGMTASSRLFFGVKDDLNNSDTRFEVKKFAEDTDGSSGNYTNYPELTWPRWFKFVYNEIAKELRVYTKKEDDDMYYQLVRATNKTYIITRKYNDFTLGKAYHNSDSNAWKADILDYKIRDFGFTIMVDFECELISSYQRLLQLEVLSVFISNNQILLQLRYDTHHPKDELTFAINPNHSNKRMALVISYEIAQISLTLFVDNTYYRPVETTLIQLNTLSKRTELMRAFREFTLLVGDYNSPDGDLHVYRVGVWDEELPASEAIHRPPKGHYWDFGHVSALSVVGDVDKMSMGENCLWGRYGIQIDDTTLNQENSICLTDLPVGEDNTFAIAVDMDMTVVDFNEENDRMYTLLSLVGDNNWYVEVYISNDNFYIREYGLFSVDSSTQLSLTHLSSQSRFLYVISITTQDSDHDKNKLVFRCPELNTTASVNLSVLTTSLSQKTICAYLNNKIDTNELTYAEAEGTTGIYHAIRTFSEEYADDYDHFVKLNERNCWYFENGGTLNSVSIHGTGGTWTKDGIQLNQTNSNNPCFIRLPNICHSNSPLMFALKVNINQSDISDSNVRYCLLSIGFGLGDNSGLLYIKNSNIYFTNQASLGSDSGGISLSTADFSSDINICFYHKKDGGNTYTIYLNSSTRYYQISSFDTGIGLSNNNATWDLGWTPHKTDGSVKPLKATFKSFCFYPFVNSSNEWLSKLFNGQHLDSKNKFIENSSTMTLGPESSDGAGRRWFITGDTASDITLTHNRFRLAVILPEDISVSLTKEDHPTSSFIFRENGNEVAAIPYPAKFRNNIKRGKVVTDTANLTVPFGIKFKLNESTRGCSLKSNENMLAHVSLQDDHLYTGYIHTESSSHVIQNRVSEYNDEMIEIRCIKKDGTNNTVAILLHSEENTFRILQMFQIDQTYFSNLTVVSASQGFVELEPEVELDPVLTSVITDALTTNTDGAWIKDRGDIPTSGTWDATTSSNDWTFTADGLECDGSFYHTSSRDPATTHLGADILLLGDFLVYDHTPDHAGCVEVTVDVTPNDDDTWGVILNYDATARTYYKLAIDIQRGKRAHIIKVNGDTSRVAKTSIDNLEVLQGQADTYTISLKSRDGVVQAYINGILVGHFVDSDPLSGGKIALANAATGSNGTNGKPAVYKNLRLEMFDLDPVELDPVVFNYTGAEVRYTVPQNAVTNFTIEAWGAQGGNGISNTAGSGGKGAYMKGTFDISTLGTSELIIRVGQQRENTSTNNELIGGGGGGGTFVWVVNSDSEKILLIVAGGGGGGNFQNGDGQHGNGQPGNAGNNGGLGAYTDNMPTEGNGGFTDNYKGGGAGSGGGGWFSDGTGNNWGNGGDKEGGSGGSYLQNGGANGGYGGGGAGFHGGGGGGGYTGGNGGDAGTASNLHGGGGGGSYISPSQIAENAESGNRLGNGMLKISF